jgi:phage minor structural protein
VVDTVKPILYDASEAKFETNGIGVLGDCASAVTRWTRNGIMELEMEYPITGNHYDDLRLRNLILAPYTITGNPQPYRIYEITRPIGGMVTVYARHISYDLAGVVVEPFSATSTAEALLGLKNHAATDCPFEFWTDKTVSAKFSVDVPTAIWTLLGGAEGSILDAYGTGEYEFDRWTVKLHTSWGFDRGVRIRYGKNLTDLRQEENCESVYTGIYPYWYGPDGDLVQLDSKLVNAPGTYGYIKILPVDFSGEWEEAPSQADLLARAQKYVDDNNIGVPRVSIEVSFVQLEQTKEYAELALMERVEPCDTVTVEFPAMGVATTAEVVETAYNVLLGRYDSVTLGDARSNFTDTIINQGEEIKKRPTDSFMRTAIEQLTANILGAQGGSVRLLDTNGDGEPDTLYIADDPDPTKAVKVWRFNYQGWGASANGYNGPFTMGASLESGIVADFITTGTLNANLIKTGCIDAANVSLSGEFSVYQTSGGTKGGSIGYMQGSTGKDTTDGIGVADATGENYVVATNAGVRIQTGTTRIFLLNNGYAYIDGNLAVSGSITEHATW